MDMETPNCSNPTILTDIRHSELNVINDKQKDNDNAPKTDNNARKKLICNIETAN